ncbi:ABC transporter ATP-binding protein [Psychrobacter sp. I-STPA10]|uniref:ABC transporter ATP-binding protein n=1 Tax=Psychrobacter sp. I-STPA10 TaxID=2585769 RepID=UPI001E2FFAC2|nr:ABC transporter ATP-binding protein [Psychrobacter sp. I-STPA10]
MSNIAQTSSLQSEQPVCEQAGLLFRMTDITVQSSSKTLLDITSLDIYKQRLTAFIGPNGAGKSTLLHSLLNKNMSARLQMTGNIQTAMGSHDALISQGKIAWVGQHEQFELPLDTLQYALLGVSPNLAWYQNPQAQHIARARQLLHDFELDNLMQARVQTLSGGERQRLAIVRALMQETQILMLDEPTNHLDIRHQRYLLSYLQQLVHQQNKSVIVVLHDLAHAYRYSDEVVLINQGKIIAQGDPAQVMSADNLSQVYQVDISAYDTDGGRVFI